jgi:hypothetical protein
MRRFLGEEGSWESHLQKTRQTILDEFNRINPKTVAVLGSGWLLDVPVKEILEGGATVKLIDIAHPQRIKHKFGSNPNIQLVDYDLTGCIDTFLDFAKSLDKINANRFIDSLRFPKHKISLDDDFCISVNTLSQLHVLFANYLTRQKGNSNVSADEIAKAVQQAHIDFLPKGRSLLITDFEEELYDEEEKLVGVNPRVFINLNQYQKVKSWSWNFDTRKTYNSNFNVKLNVIASRI